MRPLQRRLAEAVGIRWSDFALVSPDIWRKYLLDYGSLGEAARYAGMLTGQELEIVDEKLDRYMDQKAERGRMSHLLIDRFRFDSFALDSDEEDGSRLLTRFGHLVYMFFMITPPDATVERAWRRGQQVGRYKAVDDLLDHNIEAYTGMPRLFFTWALRADKAVHYEFLDNSVPEGQRPRTVAFGWNGEMNVLDVKCLLDVERYRKINVAAKSPADVYPDAGAMAPGPQRRLPAGVRAQHPGDQLRRARERRGLRANGIGQVLLHRSGGARQGARRRRRARRSGRAGAGQPSRARPGRWRAEETRARASAHRRPVGLPCRSISSTPQRSAAATCRQLINAETNDPVHE